jgi:LSD1 subclass zinc finger protein
MSTRAYHPNQQHDTPQLRDRDREFLAARAIAPDVAAERGYTATDGGNLAALGFSRTQQALGAGLLIKVHTVDGGVAYQLLRPDTPRVDDDGKAGPKYEVPAGQRLVIDAHPRIRPQLGNPTVPLLICESAPKADACISLGYVAISVNGVWGWRGTNEHGGKTILTDFEAIALNDRPVVIAFDSDTWTNHHVADATERLGAYLSRKGHVRVCRIPTAPDGSKQGIDDYIASGGDIAQLLADAVPLGQFTLERPRPLEPEHDHDAAYWQARAEAAEQRYSSVIQTLNNPTFTPTEAVVAIRAMIEYERLAAAGQVDGKRATLYLPELTKPIYTDRDTGRVLERHEVYQRRDQGTLDDTTDRHASLAPATASRALKTVAERSHAFVIAEMKDPTTGKTRLTMEPVHAVTRETMDTLATTFVQVDRRRGKHKPKDPRLANLEPCPACDDTADVVILAEAYCGSCDQHLGTLPRQRIPAPFQNETVETGATIEGVAPSPPSRTSRRSKRNGTPKSWESRTWQADEIDPELAGYTAPVQTETDPLPADPQPPLRLEERRGSSDGRCSICQTATLYTPESQARGTCTRCERARVAASPVAIAAGGD